MTVPSGPEDRLDSWKEIASYLKRGVRTVQRWEHIAGLPVHRLGQDRQSSVFAYKAELDAWWAGHSQTVAPAGAPEIDAAPRGEPEIGVAPAAQRRRPVWAAALILLVAACLGLARWEVLRRSALTVLDPVPLTADLGSEIEPSFSPDGDQVAYAWDGGAQNKWDVYVKTIGSDSPLKLTRSPQPNGDPAWSPDGRLIALHRYFPEQERSQLLVIPPTGGSERIVTEDSRTDGPIAWTPDSRWIVTSASETPHGPLGLVAIDSESGEVRRLTKPAQPNWYDSDPAVAPDDGSLIFSRDLGSTSELYRLKLTSDFRPDGAPEQITAHHRWTGMPVFTASGNAIVYSSGIKDDVASLWLLPLAPVGQPRLLLRSSNSSYQPALSRSRNRLAFSVGRIFRVDTWRLDVTPGFKPAGTPVRLISSTHTDYNAQYSPDGKRIVFHSTRSGASEIWVSDADGGNAARLTDFNAPITGSPRWSPDGEWIVFDSNKEGQFEVYRVRASGGTPERLTHDPATDGVASYSHDGRFIYFMSNRGGSNQVWKMDADGRRPRQITKQGGYLAFESYDRRWLYYSRTDGDSPLYRAPVDGGEETQVLPRVNEFGFCVTPNGILFSGGGRSTGIEFLSFETGKVSPFFRPDGQMTVGLSLSPDGRHLLFPQRESSGSDLMLVENFPENP
jgi:Tol biopolymer transport system component